MTTKTQSGDYKLPGRFSCAMGNFAIRAMRIAPKAVKTSLLRRHKFYQASGEALETGQQGFSHKKWEAIRGICDVRGKRVLDIGCAEGYFARQAAHSGATDVLGVESRLGTALCARVLALDEGLPVRIRIGVFPQIGFDESFDVIFCFSVLHHLVSTKDLWSVLTNPQYSSDLEKLRGFLRFLCSKTLPGGSCVIELPYEYERREMKQGVDLDRFCSELCRAGYASARRAGTWEYRSEHGPTKDRILYVADQR